MALRVTQTYISVLMESNVEVFESLESAISLTSTAVASLEVQTAASTLSLVSTASAPHTYHPTASSTLVLTQAASGAGPITRSGSSAIDLTQTATSGIHTAFALNLLILTDVGRLAETNSEAVSHSLLLLDSAHVFNMHVRGTSTLDLVSLADTTEKLRSTDSAISLTDSASTILAKHVISTLDLVSEATQGILTVSAADTIVLDSEAHNQNIRVLASPSILTLTDSAHSSIHPVSASSTLSLVQTIDVRRPWYATATSPLTTVETIFDLDTFSLVDVISGLTDAASVTIIGPRSLTSVLSFASIATKVLVSVDAIAVDADNTLSMTQEARLSIPVDASSALVLTQTAAAQTGTPVSNALAMTSTASCLKTQVVSAASALEVKQAVAFVLESGDMLCSYSPFIGESSDPDAPAPPPATYTLAQGTPGFRLQYPSTGPVTDELILRAPNLGNLDRLAMTRINRETRGGTLVVFADPIWPKVQTLLLSFSGLSDTEGQGLLAFMEDHIGEEIRLIDWEDRLWVGVIVNPQDPVVQDGPGCQFTASFEFEGEKV